MTSEKSEKPRRVKRREFLAATAAGTLAPALLTSSSAQVGSRSGQPNFVFILTDDQRWDSLSATGHPFARTPNLDRLAHEGGQFTNAFVTTSLCSPSRGSFLTGLYTHSHGIRDNFGDIRETTWTFPRVLQGAGYETGFFGKWHMGYDRDTRRPGFDAWLSFKGQGTYFDPELNIDGQRRRVEGYTTDLITDRAVSWIGQRSDRPFLAFVSHKAVHNPRRPAPRHEKAYENADYPLPASYHDSYDGKPAWQKARRASRTGVDGRFPDRNFSSLTHFAQQTARTVASVDDGVGKILEALEAAGKLEQTVVIFAGDNGFFLGEHGFLNKRAMYEESIRIPFLVRYPKLINPGTTIAPMTLNIDLAPSLLDLSGVEVPAEMKMQGLSWVPLLRGREEELRTSWLYEYFYEPRFAPTPTMQGVRTTRWKYVRYPNIQETDELYDLENDPTEMRNLAAAPAARSQLDFMRQELYRLLRESQGA